MVIDCDSCELRDIACDDCVVTAILDRHESVEIDEGEQRALRALAEGGMVAPLRLVTSESRAS